MSEDFLQHCKQLHQLPECYIVILTEFRDYTGTNFAATTGNFKLSPCAILIYSIQGELYTEQGLMDAPSLFPPSLPFLCQEPMREHLLVTILRVGPGEEAYFDRWQIQQAQSPDKTHSNVMQCFLWMQSNNVLSLLNSSY